MTESEIIFENAKYLGINLVELYDEAGYQIAKRIVEKFGKNKSISVICGLGGNGGDGVSTAFHLASMEVKSVTVYLVGRSSQIHDPVTESLWKEVKGSQKDLKNLKLLQDIYAKDVVQTDLIVEAIAGTGLTGNKLTKRLKDIVSRFSHFNAKKIALDLPVYHYTADLTYSLIYPKAKDAEVISIKLPHELENYSGAGEFKALWKPKTKTHKLKNGHMLFIDSDGKLNSKVQNFVKDYYVQFAAFNFNPENTEKSKAKSLDANQLENLLASTDSIVIGDISENIISFATLNYIIQNYSNKNFIFFGNSLNIIELEKFRKLNNKVLVLKKNDLANKLLKSEKIDEGKLKRFAIETNSEIAFVGPSTIIFSRDGEQKFVRKSFISIADLVVEIASKLGAYSTKNNIWLSLRAAIR